MLEYLEKQEILNPDACAAVDENNSCTYKELAEACRHIGSARVEIDVASRPVMVFMEKSIPMLSAFLGVLYGAAFYTPVDPFIPQARFNALYLKLEKPLVIVDEATMTTARSFVPDAHIVSIDELSAHKLDLPALAAVRRGVLDIDPAYVLFTSGSTGTPKGVVVNHRAIIDFIDSFVRLFDITSKDVIGNQAPFDFDVSVKDIYGALATGATLAIIPRRLFSQPAALLDELNERQVTVMTWAVAALCLISGLHGLDYRGLPLVKKVLFSGEVMPLRHLKTWMEKLPQALFVNLYGPTEITCNCSYHILDRGRDYSNGIPIGEVFPNRQILLFDEQGNLVNEPDVIAELCVRGTSLALGYYGADAQTQAAFTQNMLQQAYPDYIYHTGDLASYSAQGELFYRGRVDNQIKHQGHRIELEEIEAALERQPGVDRCRCVYDAKKHRISAFIEGVADETILRETLESDLPLFMIPNAIWHVDDMPLTKNGKVNREELARIGDSKRREFARQARLSEQSEQL